MGRVLGDAALRAELARRGLERVHMFSWQRSVARVREVYVELAGAGVAG
jgi:glycosyltransferase involved in cell wall biosynthesis